MVLDEHLCIKSHAYTCHAYVHCSRIGTLGGCRSAFVFQMSLRMSLPICAMRFTPLLVLLPTPLGLILHVL